MLQRNPYVFVKCIVLSSFEVYVRARLPAGTLQVDDADLSGFDRLVSERFFSPFFVAARKP